MPAFRPGIGEEQEGARQAALGQGSQQQAGVIAKDTDIVQAALLDMAKQAGHAVDEGFRPDDADLGMGFRLGRQMFAAAEADLEPDFIDGAGKQGLRVEHGPGGRHGHRQPLKAGLEDRGLARAELVAGAPAEDLAADLRVSPSPVMICHPLPLPPPEPESRLFGSWAGAGQAGVSPRRCRGSIAPGCG